MTDLDQLVFGWSEDGLEGRNRLQMVAASPAWQEDGRYRRVARRLSRLDASGDRDPISFGWADLGGRRFVFHRRMVPSLTGDARRLVSHVVAGDPRDLPVDLMLRSYGSSFWWAGEPVPAVLRGAMPADLISGWSEARRPAASPVAHALLGRILVASAGTPVAFEGSPAELYAALWTINDHLPRLLESLSCSTYETGQMATWFDVVGLDGRPRPRGTVWCPRSATEPRYDGRQLTQLATVVDLAAHELTEPGPESPKVFRDVLHVAERVVVGKTEAIPKLVTRNRTLAAVLASDVGARGVADAVWGLDQQAWPKVPATADHAPRLTQLAVQAAEAAQPHAEATFGVVARRLHAINPRTGPVFVERVLRRRAAGERLPTPDQDFLAAALGWAYQTELSDEVLTALMHWVDQNLTGALLADRRLPDPWRAVLFEESSAQDRLEVEDYAELAERHPSLFDNTGWLPKDPAVLARLAITPGALRRVTTHAIAAEWAAPDAIRLGLGLLGHGQAATACTLLDAICRQDSSPLGAEVSTAVWNALTRMVLEVTTGRLDVGLFELPWSMAARLTPTSEWIGAVASVMLGGRGDAERRAIGWTQVVARASGEARAALVQVALHDIALTSPIAWTFQGRVGGLPVLDVEPTTRARTILTALERRTDAVGETMPALLLALRACVVRTGFLRLRVTAGECEDSARRQVQAMLAEDPSAFRAVRPDLDRPVLQWLRKVGAV